MLNPAMSLVLAVAFLLFWIVLPSQRYLASLAAGYAISALGFLFQRFELPLVGFEGTKLLSNLSFAAAVLCIASAVCLRYDRKVPYAALLALLGGGIAAFIWFLYVDPNLTWRIYAMNFALGGASVLIAFELRAVPEKTFIDKILYGATLFTAFNFFARTISLIYFYGAFQNYDGFYNSTYWTSLLLSHALISLTIALCLIAAAAMDMFKRLSAESRTDPLSGLLNRRGFENRAAGLQASSGSDAFVFSLVMADLDHFKSVNDTHGHLAGDAVITAFAKLLQKICDSKAVVGRTGGEEFAVLLPSLDLAAAQVLAEKVRTALAAGLPGAAGAAAGRLTCSFGVAERSTGESFEAVFKRADDALMHAKRAGRDRVRVAYVRPALLPAGLAAA